VVVVVVVVVVAMDVAFVGVLVHTIRMQAVPDEEGGRSLHDARRRRK
jgi:hypothetical protein